MRKRTVTNTRAETESDPMRAMLEAMDMGSDFIEVQERRGQREVATSDELPMKGSEHPAWAKMGVVMGSVKPDDPLFRFATLPEASPEDHRVVFRRYAAQPGEPTVARYAGFGAEVVSWEPIE